MLHLFISVSWLHYSKVKIIKIMEEKLMVEKALIPLLYIYMNTPITPFRKEKIRITLIKLLTMHVILSEKKKKKRSMWVRPIYTVQQRFLQGDSDNLISMLRINDHSLHFNYLRMDINIFDELLAIVGPVIEKQMAVREPIPAYTRLQICLRYLASGDSIKSVGYAFRTSPNTVAQIVHETCDAIWCQLKDIVLRVPNKDEWMKIATDFEEMWQFIHCIGAIDGKHVMLQSPPHSGSKYYNYKRAHSINFTGVADAHCRFILVDVGKEGRCSDGGIFANSPIKYGLETNTLNIPPPAEVGGRRLPYTLIADEAYPLSKYLMRPYPRSSNLDLKKKVFNYRLSRPRRVVESGFGIWTARWRIFRRPINTSVSRAEKIVLATICLHNFIITRELQRPRHQRRYLQYNEYDQQLESYVRPNIINSTNDQVTSEKNVGSIFRDRFAEYFFNEGAVEWQWDKAANNDF